MDNQENFPQWLDSEIKKREWKQADLVRESGLDSAVISNIINGKRKLGETTATAIARALRYPPEIIFEKAGILPPSKTDLTMLQRIIIELVKHTPDPELEMIQTILNAQQSKKANAKK